MFAEHLTQEPFHSLDSDTVGGVQPQDSGLKCQRWCKSSACAHMRVKRRAVHLQNKRRMIFFYVTCLQWRISAEEVNLNACLQDYITFLQVLVMVVRQKIMINFLHDVFFPLTEVERLNPFISNVVFTSSRPHIARDILACL